MTPASLSVSASVFDATPGDASTIAATCDGQLRTNARRPSATGGWGSRKRVHRRLLVCLRLVRFDATTGDGVRRVTRARTVGWEGVRGGCVAAAGLSTAASHRGILFMRTRGCA